MCAGGNDLEKSIVGRRANPKAKFLSLLTWQTYFDNILCSYICSNIHDTLTRSILVHNQHSIYALLFYLRIFKSRKYNSVFNINFVNSRRHRRNIQGAKRNVGYCWEPFARDCVQYLREIMRLE